MSFQLGGEEIREFSTESDAKQFVRERADHQEPWHAPLRIVPAVTGPSAPLTLKEFLPLSSVPMATAETDEVAVHREFELLLPSDLTCYLDASWRWEEIARDIWMSEGHAYERRANTRIVEVFVNVAYD